MLTKNNINQLDHWIKYFPQKPLNGHKYHSGHAIIYGAPMMTGASRLAATAGARMGCGLVTVLVNPLTAKIYRTALPAHIIVRDDYEWHDSKITARLYGSGGLDTKIDFDAPGQIILDADALQNLPSILSTNIALTPHEGEFDKAFPQFANLPFIQKAIKASQAVNAIIVLKGAHSVIARPDAGYLVQTESSPHLASGGSGDVLAGMITGLAARISDQQPDWDLFKACAAAVYIHAMIGKMLGAGLVASDLLDKLPHFMKQYDISQ